MENFGTSIAQWLTTNMISLWVAVSAVVAIYFVVQREFSRFMGWIIVSFLVGLVIVNPGGFMQKVVEFLGTKLVGG